MRLIALLSWFDEPVPALVRCLTALRRVMDVDHVVALDGRYALFPADSDVSAPDQARAIILACEALGMGVDVRVPEGTWSGEVEKRTALFRDGLEAAQDGDWFVVMDADQVVTRSASDLRNRLLTAQEDTADVMFCDDSVRYLGEGFTADFPMRIMFRAQPIEVRDHHANYVAADGRVLWCAQQQVPQVAGLDLTQEVVVNHLPQERATERLLAKQTYYALRDDAGIEFGRCECGEPATQKVHGRWRRSRETGRMVAQILTLCDKHAEAQWRRDERKLRSMGLDPGSMRSREFYGRAPR